MDTTQKPQLSHISLCFGYGGIDLGLHRIFGDRLRLAAVCEIEAFALENALSKMEAGLLPPAPIWTDLRTFPWEEFQNVSLVSGGFPCQPFSAAGKRDGDQDPRHLFPFIIDGIKRCRPGLVFLENVEGILSSKLTGEGWADPAGTPVLLHVLRELERVGYKATAGIFSASEVGAPHQRKRVFILAHREGERLPQFANIRAVWREVCTTSISGQLANGNEQRLERGIQQGVSPKEKQNEFIAGYGGALANSNGARGWEDRESSESWPTCTEQPSSDSRGSESRQIREGQAWPSRPGEPQYAWEPPRVVGSIPEKLANFCTGNSQSRGNTAQASSESVGKRGEGANAMPHGGSSLCGGDQGDEQAGLEDSNSSRGEKPEHQHTNLPSEPSWGCAEAMGNASHWSNGEQPTEQQGRHSVGGSGEEGAMGNATSERPHRGGEDGLGLQPEMLGEGYEAMGDTESRRTGGCGNKDSEREGLGFIGTSPSGGMGDTEQLLLPTTREHGTMDEASGIPANGKGCESSQADSIASAAREREGNGSNASECSEIEFSMGDPAYGTKFGLGLTELSGLSHCELAEIREWMVKTDNRTDELRLLGNGCVPATVSRAFLILLEKLK